MSRSESKKAVTTRNNPNSESELRPFYEWSSVEIDKAFRHVVSEQDTADLKIAWLANHTVEPVSRAATVFADTYGVQIDNLIGPYDQYFQALLEEDSDILAGNPDVIVLWLSLRVLAPALVEGGAELAEVEVSNEIERVCETIGDWVSLGEKNTKAHLIICNFVRPPSLRFGIADTSCSTGEQFIYHETNRRLSEKFISHPRVTVADVNQAVSLAGSESAWNPRMYRLAKIEWDGRAARSIALLLARSFRALVKPARKCIVLDLDNTLWGGVLGEDGPTAIRVAEGDPTGESFAAFQRALKDLRARGILLAICSKNNQEDVEELYITRPEMPLQAEDFSASRVNWESKHENIIAIAEELNIGTDSLVFIDDNPAECELVRQLLPEVKTIQLPDDPADYADLVIGLPDFDKIKLTDEDRQKGAQYAANSVRVVERRSSTDLTSYLESLGTELTIRPAAHSDLTRVHQLFTKTNQFNVTTIRYGTSDIQEFVDSEDCILNIASVSDNFGDLGIVGLYLLRLNGDKAEIDSFILSCRALGRGIETAICNQLKQSVFEDFKSRELSARFAPTAKNRPAANFFDQQGFEHTVASEGGQFDYCLLRQDSSELPAPGIDVTIKENLE